MIAYPSAVIEEPSYESVGIKNAWFGIYQQEAREAGLVVPERPQDLDKQTRQAARQQFKKTAENFSGQEVTIKKERNERTGKKELIAYTGSVRLGAISDPRKLTDGQKVNIRCSFARSSDLRIAYSGEVIPIHKTDSNESES